MTDDSFVMCVAESSATKDNYTPQIAFWSVSESQSFSYCTQIDTYTTISLFSTPSVEVYGIAINNPFKAKDYKKSA